MVGDENRKKSGSPLHGNHFSKTIPESLRKDRPASSHRGGEDVSTDNGSSMDFGGLVYSGSVELTQMAPFYFSGSHLFPINTQTFM